MSIKTKRVFNLSKIDDKDITLIKQIVVENAVNLAFQFILDLQNKEAWKNGEFDKLDFGITSDVLAEEITINDKNVEMVFNHKLDLHKGFEYKMSNIILAELTIEDFKNITEPYVDLVVSIVRIGNHRYFYYEMNSVRQDCVNKI